MTDGVVPTWSIELWQRQLNIGGASHAFWVLRDDSSTVVREMHGLSTREDGSVQATGLPWDRLDTIQIYDIDRNNMKDDRLSDSFDGTHFMSEVPAFRATGVVAMTGNSSEALAIWASAVNRVALINSFLIPYDPLTDKASGNSNTAAAYIGLLMGLSPERPLFQNGNRPFYYGWNADLKNLLELAIIQKIQAEVDGDGLSEQERLDFVAQLDSIQPPAAECFVSGTQVRIDALRDKNIENMIPGDIVLAFDPAADFGRGALVPRRITRHYRNTTTEWIKLNWLEDGEPKELITTPGHHFLNDIGQFPTIAAMLRDGQTTVVLADGSLTEVTATRISYAADTAHLFDRALSFAATGNAAAQAVEMDCWQTYNFEVEDLHTYVAGGVRVHNDSGWLGRAGDAACVFSMANNPLQIQMSSQIGLQYAS